MQHVQKLRDMSPLWEMVQVCECVQCECVRELMTAMQKVLQLGTRPPFHQVQYMTESSCVPAQEGQDLSKISWSQH